MAESLEAVHDPLAVSLRAPAPAAAAGVAAALARALLPVEAADTPPAWLRPDQRLSFARALAAARAYGGALIADGVGTGKTYIGLAVSQALAPASTVHVLAPAALRTQWERAAGCTGLTIRFHSHETLSRGRPPRNEPGPVVIDECHRFRAPSTRRYDVAAAWMVGRKGVLLSATPAVNRLADVAHQLNLVVRSDLLELERQVVTGEDRSQNLPSRRQLVERPLEPPSSPFELLRRGIGGLTLSSHSPVAALLRVVFWHALSSSPAALAEAFRRYRLLLLHARDALGAGASLSRAFIRRIVGAEADQLVLWPLVAEDTAPPELALDDLDRLAMLEDAARRWCLTRDAKAARLAEVCGDGRRTLVFTTLTATVRHLRAHLDARVAWCTGHGAGYGHQPVPRDTVLDWFRREPTAREAGLRRPTVLVATDVAAEGLDLPLLERVVHYDLPWTAVRLEQRSGRAVRLGTTTRQVEVIRFAPPASLEAELNREAILEAKSMLPERAGLGAAERAPWRVRAQTAAVWADSVAREGIASFAGEEAATVAGFRIVLPDGSRREHVVARIGGKWTADLATIARLLEQTRGAPAQAVVSTGRVQRALRSLRPLIRQALRRGNGHGVVDVAHTPPERRMLRRLVRLADEASRRRDLHRLNHLERRLAFLRRGHTAGERRLIERLAEAPISRLLAELPGETVPARGAARAEILSILFMEREGGPR